MGCVYKILAKLIANRMRKMRKVLGKMIDYCLSVFTGGGNFYIAKWWLMRMLMKQGGVKRHALYLKLILSRCMILSLGNSSFTC